MHFYKHLIVALILLCSFCFAQEKSLNGSIPVAKTPVDSVAYYDSLASDNYQRFRANESMSEVFFGRVLDCPLPLRFWCLLLEVLQIVMVPKGAEGEMLFWMSLHLPLQFYSCLLGLLMVVSASQKSGVSGISIITIEKKRTF